MQWLIQWLRDNYLWLIPLLPLLGAIINGIAGKRIQDRHGKTPITLVACAMVIGSFLVTCIAFWNLLHMTPGARYPGGLLTSELVKWIWVSDVLPSMPNLQVRLALSMDQLGAVMALTVTGVSSLIHIYSVGYMADDKSYWRYFSYLNLFVFAMLILVLADNFLLMFVGWEGVGLCSYLLIGFWYSDEAKAKAGMKAFITNRIGDFAFIIGVMVLFWGIGDGLQLWTLTFRELDSKTVIDFLSGNLPGKEPVIVVLGMKFDIVTTVCVLFFIGATGKSAQFPLYVWLPDAMAGPTPVSALIHAATMVTAGVYMIARTNFLYSLSPTAMGIVALVGAVTALGAATIALVQNDIKKVLAYSTVSQLGYMFIAVGVGAYWAGIFHLVTHAFFKACLFMGSGSVIHSMHAATHHDGEDPQDIRNMGGLKEKMKVTYWTFLVSTAAIAGFPFLSGFFSKDAILLNAMTAHHKTGSIFFSSAAKFAWLLGTIAAFLTAFYMFRLVYRTFHGRFRLGEEKFALLHESPSSMIWPLRILALLAIVGGFLETPFFGHYFTHWLGPVVGHAHHPSMLLEVGMWLVALAIFVGGWWLASRYYLYDLSRPKALAQQHPTLYDQLLNKYYVDEFYQKVVIDPTIRGSRNSASFDRRVIDGAVHAFAWIVRWLAYIDGWFDRRVIDGIVNKIAAFLLYLGQLFRQFQTGQLRTYLYAVLAGVIGMVVLGTLLWF